MAIGFMGKVKSSSRLLNLHALDFYTCCATKRQPQPSGFVILYARHRNFVSFHFFTFLSPLKAMAELAGSIIGIVSAGTKVTLVLSQLAADVGSAGKEARMIGSEIRSFCSVIKTLGETLGKVQTSRYYDHCSGLIEPMTATSMEMFTEILDASEKLKGIVKGKDGKDGTFGLVGRLQWAVFQKPKIMVLRAAIEAYKSNLALMLATLNIAEKVARQPCVYPI
jgi:hypothetical protein